MLRIQTTWGRSKQCFGEAAKLFSPSFERVEIPYEGTTLPGYFYIVGNDFVSHYSAPGGMRTGFEYYRAFPQDEIENQRLSLQCQSWQ